MPTTRVLSFQTKHGSQIAWIKDVNHIHLTQLLAVNRSELVVVIETVRKNFLESV